MRSRDSTALPASMPLKIQGYTAYVAGRLASGIPLPTLAAIHLVAGLARLLAWTSVPYTWSKSGEGPSPLPVLSLDYIPFPDTDECFKRRLETYWLTLGVIVIAD